MGGVLPSGSALSISASISGARGDEFVLIGSEGEIARQTINGSEFMTEFPIPHKAQFVRGEVQARASRKQILEEAFAAFSANGLPRGLDVSAIEQAPLRRALSNPIYFENSIQ